MYNIGNQPYSFQTDSLSSIDPVFGIELIMIVPLAMCENKRTFVSLMIIDYTFEFSLRLTYVGCRTITAV